MFNHVVVGLSQFNATLHFILEGPFHVKGRFSLALLGHLTVMNLLIQFAHFFSLRSSLLSQNELQLRYFMCFIMLVTVKGEDTVRYKVGKVIS
jgi:hypothetical protein